MLTLNHLTGFGADAAGGGASGPPPGVYTVNIITGSAYSTSSAGYAVFSDGDTNTGWAASTGSTTLEFVWPSAVLISSIGLQPITRGDWGNTWGYNCPVTVQYLSGGSWLTLTMFNTTAVTSAYTVSFYPLTFTPAATTALRFVAVGAFNMAGFAFG